MAAADSKAEQAPYLTDPTGREHPLTGDQIVVGRAVECDIVITSKRVSREHARVRRDGWRVMLEDLGSTNGTFLNDERIMSSTALHDEDRIKVGDVILTFHDPDITFRDTPFPELQVDVAAGVVRAEGPSGPSSSSPQKARTSAATKMPAASAARELMRGHLRFTRSPLLASLHSGRDHGALGGIRTHGLSLSA